MKTTDVIIVADVSGSMFHLERKQKEAIWMLVQDMAADEREHVFFVAIHPFGQNAGDIKPFKAASSYTAADFEGLCCNEGSTKLADAVGFSLEMTKRRNSEAALIQVITDGGENASLIWSHDGKSRNYPRQEVRNLRAELDAELAKGRLTLAATGPSEARAFFTSIGLNADNFRIWDGVSAASYGQTMSATTQSMTTFATERKAGRTRSVKYYADATKLTTPGIRGMTKKVEPSEVKAVSKHMDGRAIADFFKKFEKGRHYYQLVKPEYIDEDKDLVVHDKQSNEYRQGSRTVRMLLNLPEQGRLRVYPGPHSAQFDIYVQSASVNRKLVEGQKLLTL